jgi:hypothetical protein
VLADGELLVRLRAQFETVQAPSAFLDTAPCAASPLTDSKTQVATVRTEQDPGFSRVDFCAARLSAILQILFPKKEFCWPQNFLRNLAPAISEKEGEDE